MTEDGIGWLIVAAFSMTVILLASVAVVKLFERCFKKRYGIFLSHHKDGARLLVRCMKIQLQSATKSNIFLDVDDRG